MSRHLEGGSDGQAEATDRVHASGSGDSYAADRRSRLRRGRLVGFAVGVPLWVVSTVPLARESMDGREGADRVLVYLGVAALSLGVAAVIRGVYVMVMKRRFWSPWLFPLAALVAIIGYTVQSAGEEEVPFSAALHPRGVAIYASSWPLANASRSAARCSSISFASSQARLRTACSIMSTTATPRRSGEKV